MNATDSAQAVAFVLLVIFLGYVALILVPFLRRKPRVPGDASAFTFHAFLPARDEEAVIGDTITRFRERFPAIHVWIVDDASEDGTRGIVQAAVDRDPMVHLVERNLPNARTGKGDALNAAYRDLSAWLPDDADRSRIVVVVLDADGRLSANALEQAAGERGFADPRVGAVQAAVWMSNRDVKQPLGPGGRNRFGRFLIRMQDIEFRTTIAAMQELRGHTSSVGLGGNGQFSRLSALDAVAGTYHEPWHGALLEDYELSIHVMLAGYTTSYVHDANVEQEALPSLRRLLTQRVRWCQGGIQCVRYLPSIVKSRHFSNAGVLEMSYFMVMPFIQLLGMIVWPTVFIAMAANGTIAAGSLAAWAQASWWLLPLIVLTGILPFAIWPMVYWRRSAREHSFFAAVGWSFGYWLYMYMTYICVIRAFWRIIRGKNGWAKTRRNAENLALETKEQ